MHGANMKINNLPH